MKELEYIKRFDPVYPGIDLWFEKKVLNDNRLYWSVKDCNEIIGLVIIDIFQSKLCHLSVLPKYCNRGVGHFLYKQSMIEFSLQGITKIFCHGTPEIVQQFMNAFSGWEIVGDYGNFGREIKDVKIIQNNII